jgi:hypothetical protein
MRAEAWSGAGDSYSYFVVVNRRLKSNKGSMLSTYQKLPLSLVVPLLPSLVHLPCMLLLVRAVTPVDQDDPPLLTGPGSSPPSPVVPLPPLLVHWPRMLPPKCAVTPADQDDPPKCLLPDLHRSLQ